MPTAQLPSQSADIQLQLGRVLFDQGQYPEALDAYRNAVTSADSRVVRQARAGLIQSLLRVAGIRLRAHRGQRAGQDGAA